MTAIKNSQNLGGILGALQTTSDGSLSSFLGQGTTSANNFATIAQTGVSSATTFYTQLAAQNSKDHNAGVLQKVLNDLSASQNMVKAKNVLSPVIYFNDGTTIDTNSNIMTKPDGTQYDITTGAKYRRSRQSHSTGRRRLSRHPEQYSDHGQRHPDRHGDRAQGLPARLRRGARPGSRLFTRIEQHPTKR